VQQKIAKRTSKFPRRFIMFVVEVRAMLTKYDKIWIDSLHWQLEKL